MIPHSFNPFVAKELGLECAILLFDIEHWIEANIELGMGNWVKLSFTELYKFFFYIKKDKIKESLLLLIEKGIVIKHDKKKNFYTTNKFLI